MANRIVAVNTYRPKLKLGNTVQMKELGEFIADRTVLNKSDLQIALSELSATIIFFTNLAGALKSRTLAHTCQPSVSMARSVFLTVWTKR
jgi:hypothetical protein